MMTVEEARAQKKCRLCGRALVSPGPADAPLTYREMVFPVKATFNFGDEYAHTQCLRTPEPALELPGF